MLVTFLLLENRQQRLTLSQLGTRLLLALVGFTFDSIIQAIGLIQFAPQSDFSAFNAAPMWLFLMWIWFTATFSVCYRWLIDRAQIAIVVGAIFGPCAYWGASKLTLVNIVEPLLFTGVSILFWGSLFALIFTTTRIQRSMFLATS